MDVSDVSPGRYRLAADVDPDNYVLERNEANNGPALASSIVTVPGYVALPVTTAASGAQAIGLTAQPYGSPGPPVFAIESAPANGTLNVPAGAPLATPQVVYTPRPGFAGNDTFTYSARDSSSAFPTHARAGVVTVTVPTASSSGRLRLLTGLRFRRHGRFLRVRGRATRSGVLRIHIKKGKRHLGACRKRVRVGAPLHLPHQAPQTCVADPRQGDRHPGRERQANRARHLPRAARRLTSRERGLVPLREVSPEARRSPCR